jgi:hypothetical protein
VPYHDLQIESVRTPARITPYPPGRLVWDAPSQALRAWLRSCGPSGTSFDGSDATGAVSRRDTPIVAWHEVPGKACPRKKPSRRVRYDRAHPIPEVFSSKCAPQANNRICPHTRTNHTVPSGTARLGRHPRHCVPGRLRRLRRASTARNPRTARRAVAT